MKPCALELPVEKCKTLGNMLARVGDKWSMMTIVSLEAGTLRFNELRRRTGASQKMQTATLRGLERDGYVTRTVTPSQPPRVDYALTDMGREILGPVRELATWALSRINRVERARMRYDERVAEVGR
jgi:DNA-binding HxlR family transcriptional regulator